MSGNAAGGEVSRRIGKVAKGRAASGRGRNVQRNKPRVRSPLVPHPDGRGGYGFRRKFYWIMNKTTDDFPVTSLVAVFILYSCSYFYEIALILRSEKLECTCMRYETIY